MGTQTVQGAFDTGPPDEWESLPNTPAAQTSSERVQHWIGNQSLIKHAQGKE